MTTLKCLDVSQTSHWKNLACAICAFGGDDIGSIIVARLNLTSYVIKVETNKYVAADFGVWLEKNRWDSARKIKTDFYTDFYGDHLYIYQETTPFEVNNKGVKYSDPVNNYCTSTIKRELNVN